eukprot:SAG31_NODE_270_length_18732_cov_9.342618_4_plen_32_part_00
MTDDFVRSPLRLVASLLLVSRLRSLLLAVYG